MAQELGVKIQLNTAVEGILFKGRRAVGVRTAQGEQRADAQPVALQLRHHRADALPGPEKSDRAIGRSGDRATEEETHARAAH